MTRTGKNQALRRSAPDPILELNRADARRFNIQDADFIEVISRRGKVMVQVRVTEEIVRGTCFLPFHLGRDEGFFNGATNLTITARDPISRQLELACAVRLREVLEFPQEPSCLKMRHRCLSFGQLVSPLLLSLTESTLITAR